MQVGGDAFSQIFGSTCFEFDALLFGQSARECYGEASLIRIVAEADLPQRFFSNGEPHALVR